MPSKARQKKIMEKLNRAQKCSILGPQNLGSKGGPGPRAPPTLDPRLHIYHRYVILSVKELAGPFALFKAYLSEYPVFSNLLPLISYAYSQFQDCLYNLV